MKTYNVINIFNHRVYFLNPLKRLDDDVSLNIKQLGAFSSTATIPIDNTKLTPEGSQAGCNRPRPG